MKKIIAIAIVVLTSVLTASAQETKPLDYDSIVGNKYGLATVYFNDGSEVTVRAMLNPGALGIADGVLTSRQAILLAAPYRPQTWDKTPDGYEPAGFYVNSNLGFYQSSFGFYGPVLIVEASYNPAKKSTVFSARIQNARWTTSPNPAEWISLYEPKKYTLPSMHIPVNVTKENGVYILGVN